MLFYILAVNKTCRKSDQDEQLPDSISISELLSELRSGLARDFFLSCGEESDSCRLLLQVAPGCWQGRMTGHDIWGYK